MNRDQQIRYASLLKRLYEERSAELAGSQVRINDSLTALKNLAPEINPETMYWIYEELVGEHKRDVRDLTASAEEELRKARESYEKALKINKGEIWAVLDRVKGRLEQTLKELDSAKGESRE